MTSHRDTRGLICRACIDDLLCLAIVGAPGTLPTPRRATMLIRRLAAALCVAFALAGVQLAGATPASAAPRVLYYDASQAQEFKAVVDQGAQIWNGRATNVRLMPVTAGRTPNI